MIEMEITEEGRGPFILTFKNIRPMAERSPPLSYTLTGNVSLDVKLISDFELLTS